MSTAIQDVNHWFRFTTSINKNFIVNFTPCLNEKESWKKKWTDLKPLESSLSLEQNRRAVARVFNKEDGRKTRDFKSQIIG